MTGLNPALMERPNNLLIKQEKDDEDGVEEIDNPYAVERGTRYPRKASGKARANHTSKPQKPDPKQRHTLKPLPNVLPPQVAAHDELSEADTLQIFPEAIKQIMTPSIKALLAKKTREFLHAFNGVTDERSKTDHELSLNTLCNPLAVQPLLAHSLRKVGALTVEERKRKVDKYLMKRKTRSWGRKISYDCRKRVADSRLRVKGRFVTKEQAFKLLDGTITPSKIPENISNNDLKALLHSKFGGVGKSGQRRAAINAMRTVAAGDRETPAEPKKMVALRRRCIVRKPSTID